MDYIFKKRILFKFKSIFMENFLYILIAFIGPLLIANIAIYKESTGIIQREAREANINMLWKTSKSIDLVFEQINYIIPQVALDKEVQNSILDPNIHNITRNISVISKIKNIASTNDYIHSLYIYSKKNQFVLSSNGGSYEWDNFYDKNWLSEYQPFYAGTKQLDTRGIAPQKGKNVNSITLIRNLPYQSWSELGALIINVNEEKLYDTIKGMDDYNKGRFMVINNEGTIVSYEEKDKLAYNLINYDFIKKILTNNQDSFIQKISNQDIMFSYVKSPYNKWTYIYMIPLSELYKDSTYVLRNILAISLTNILICLAFAFIISKKIYGPIKHLIDLVDKNSKFDFKSSGNDSNNEYDFLDQAYNYVLNNNINMQNTINNIKPIIKEKLFINLLLGKNMNVEEINGRLGLLNINFCFKNFVIMVIQIDDYNEFIKEHDEIKRNLFKLQLIDVIEKLLNEEFICISLEIESTKIVAVYNFDTDDTLLQKEKELFMSAEKIRSMVEKYFPFTVTVGIGRTYDDILKINLSYIEALKALKYKIYQGKNEIIEIVNLDQEEGELYYFNSEKEKLLVNYLKTGNTDDVIGIIEELFSEIINTRNISTNYVQQYFIRVINLIIESLLNMGLELETIFKEKRNIYDEIVGKETIGDIKRWFEEICIRIVEGIIAVNESNSNKNIEKILEYIDENFNEDISLNDVADYVKLTPSYVSTIFKDSIGDSFVSYLNKKRIEKAKQLIINTQLTIKEIGFRVGFNSMQSFFRTFKKNEGITPGQYGLNRYKED